jgi:hypothetical protein
MTTVAVQLVNRAADLAGAYGTARVLPERIDAYSLATLVVELVNQQLDLFARHCYKTTEQGELLHILPDGQLSPRNWCPWGSSAKSKLTRTQRDMLRHWLFLMEQNRLRPPWLYYPKTRRWYVDLHRYPTLDQVLVWLSRHHLTANEWLQLSRFG